MELTQPPEPFENFGNTCFFNSALQCIGSFNYLVNNFGFNIERKYLRHNLESLHEFAKNQGYTLFEPDNQNDVSECVIIIIDLLHNRLKQPLIGEDLESKLTPFINAGLKNVEMFLRKEYEKEYSPIMDLFNGIQIAKTIGLKTRLESINIEFINMLSLQWASSIEEALDDYFKVELLTENWENPSGKYERAARQIKLQSAPRLLIITLNRHNKRPNDNIKFDLILDMGKYFTQPRSNKKYRLVSFANHFGNQHMGHYTAVVLRNNKWYHCNDEIISELQMGSNFPTAFISCMFYELIE